MNTENIKNAINLFFVFLKIGCFTFGGGWSILAQMEQEFVEKREMISKEELLDIVSIGRSIPGIMIANISLIFGYQIAGILGGILAMLGLVIPSIVILSIVTIFYTMMKDNALIEKILEGIRAAVVPIIIAATCSLAKSGLKNKWSVMVCGATAAVCLLTEVNNIIIIIVGIIAALAINGGKRIWNY